MMRPMISRCLSHGHRKATSSSLHSRLLPTFSGRCSLSTTASPEQQTNNADVCDLHIVQSPFPPIPLGPYPPLYEFISQNWKKTDTEEEVDNGGYLSDKIAIIDGTTGQQRTFADYYARTMALATALQKDFDVTEHSTVAVYSPNHVDYVPISLAISLTGAKMAPVNPLYTKDELSKVLVSSRSSILFAHKAVLEVALEAVRQEDSLVKHVIVFDSDDSGSGHTAPVGTIHFNDVLEQHHDPGNHTVRETVSTFHNHDTAEHPFLLPYSSGTTGLPKGVCLTHANIVANLLQCEEIEGMAFPSDHKLISPLPFFHIYAFSVSLMHPAWQGQTVITQSRFDLETYCQLVQEHKPERTHLVPPILVGLAKHPVVDKYDLSSLRMIIGAAAPIGRNVEEAVKQRLKGCHVKQGWGMSELSPIGTLNSDFNVKPGSVGNVISSTVAKVIDPEGKSLGPNKSGELCIKGPQVMMGYLNDPEKTAECLSKSGWLRSGDVAHYDEDGFFYITDRIKELIKVRAFQVAPAELEALLLKHESIADAAVVPVPDEVNGELPRAYVVLKESASSSLTEQGIRDWVKEEVAPHKRLEGGVVFTDNIPKSASGKILRRILRDKVKAEMDDRRSE